MTMEVDIEVLRLMDVAARSFGKCIKAPSVKIKKLPTDQAGVYYRNDHLLVFNSRLLETDHSYFIKNVVPHEVAHVVVPVVHGNVEFPHGLEWQQCVRMMGCTPVISYRSPAKRKSHTWTCSCMLHYLTDTDHNSLVADGTSLVCTKCKGVLHYVMERV